MSKKKQNIEQALAKITSDVMRMNSREIAELVGSRHQDMMRSIVRLENQGVIESAPTARISTATKPMTVKVFVGEQGKRDSIIVIAQNSPTFTAALVDRWLELEKCVARLTEEERQRFFDREALRDEYPPLSAAIKESRELAGKEAKPFHYSTEADMLNKLVTGMTAKQFKDFHDTDTVRDALTPAQTKALRGLQEMDTTLVKVGMTYAERKYRLEEYHKRVNVPLLAAESVVGSAHD